MSAIVLAAVAVVLGLIAVGAHRTLRRRRDETKVVVSQLIPEIHSILSASEGGGNPLPPRAFFESRGRLPRVLDQKALFAVETFYQAVDAYRDASQAMRDAFGEASEAGLGDRIRAKDRRDRCLKDVFYAGEAAVERLMGVVD